MTRPPAPGELARRNYARQCTNLPATLAPMPMNPVDFDIYRSGAHFTLKCKRCDQSWTLAKTTLASLIGIATAHWDGAVLPALNPVAAEHECPVQP